MYALKAYSYIDKASKAHTGTYLASRVSKCLHEYGIHGKVCPPSRSMMHQSYNHVQILGLTADNASNNNTLVDDLSDLLDGFQGSLTRIRCFAHILNLVVKVCQMCYLGYIELLIVEIIQAIMSQFSQTKKASSSSLDNSEDDAALKELEDEDGEEPEELVMEDGDEIDPAVESSDSAMVDEAAAETDADDSLPQLTHEQVNLGRFSLSKVRITVNTVSAAYSSLDSSGILQNASSTAPPSVQI